MDTHKTYQSSKFYLIISALSVMKVEHSINGTWQKWLLFLFFMLMLFNLWFFFLLCSQTVSGSDGKFIKVLLLIEHIFWWNKQKWELIIAFWQSVRVHLFTCLCTFIKSYEVWWRLKIVLSGIRNQNFKINLIRGAARGIRAYNPI